MTDPTPVNNNPSASTPEKAPPAPSVNTRALRIFQNIGARVLLGASYSIASFEGDRNYNTVLGFPDTLTREHYVAMYRRSPIARRVIRLPCRMTWKRMPDITEKKKDDTEFVNAWNALLKRQPRLLDRMHRVDRVAGIHEFAIMFLGIRQGATAEEDIVDLATPATDNGESDLMYVEVYDDANASVAEWVADPNDPRYNQPLMYELTMTTSDGGSNRVFVHWTRVIHVPSEDPDMDDFYGYPRLEGVYNTLIDIFKFFHGGSEAAWQSMDRGMHADVRDDYDMSPEDEESFSDEILDYYLGLRRVIRTQGVDLKELGGETVDPSSLWSIALDMLGAGSDIPHGILVGSTRADINRAEEQRTLASWIASRRTNYAEPFILRNLIDRLVLLEILPVPSGGPGVYEVNWEASYEPTPQEKATTASLIAEVFERIIPEGAATMILTPDEIRQDLLGLPAMSEVELSARDKDPVALTSMLLLQAKIIEALVRGGASIYGAAIAAGLPEKVALLLQTGDIAALGGELPIPPEMEAVESTEEIPPEEVEEATPAEETQPAEEVSAEA